MHDLTPFVYSLSSLTHILLPILFSAYKFLEYATFFPAEEMYAGAPGKTNHCHTSTLLTNCFLSFIILINLPKYLEHTR
jgi:hypothetical protein